MLKVCLLLISPFEKRMLLLGCDLWRENTWTFPVTSENYLKEYCVRCSCCCLSVTRYSMRILWRVPSARRWTCFSGRNEYTTHKKRNQIVSSTHGLVVAKSTGIERAVGKEELISKYFPTNLIFAFFLLRWLISFLNCLLAFFSLSLFSLRTRSNQFKHRNLRWVGCRLFPCFLASLGENMGWDAWSLNSNLPHLHCHRIIFVSNLKQRYPCVQYNAVPSQISSGKSHYTTFVVNVNIVYEFLIKITSRKKPEVWWELPQTILSSVSHITIFGM